MRVPCRLLPTLRFCGSHMLPPLEYAFRSVACSPIAGPSHALTTRRQLHCRRIAVSHHHRRDTDADGNGDCDAERSNPHLTASLDQDPSVERSDELNVEFIFRGIDLDQ